MKKILIALDYDNGAQQVAEAGYELAKEMNASVILLHVVADPLYYSSAQYSPIMGFDGFINMGIVPLEEEETNLNNAAQNFLLQTTKHLGDENVKTVIEKGDTGEAILKAANENNVNIIVMGSHGRTGLDKILMGSVAEEVLHHSSIPLFIIPVKKDK